MNFRFYSLLEKIFLNKMTSFVFFLFSLFSLPYILYSSLGLSVFDKNHIIIIFFIYISILLLLIISFLRKLFLSTVTGIVVLYLSFFIIPVLIMYFFDFIQSISYHIIVTLFGYILFLVSSLVSFFHQRFLYASFIGILFLGLGSFLEYQYWEKENQKICTQLRKDPYCIESVDVFDCSEESSFGHIFRSSSVCREKLSERERRRVNKKK